MSDLVQQLRDCLSETKEAERVDALHELMAGLAMHGLREVALSLLDSAVDQGLVAVQHYQSAWNKLEASKGRSGIMVPLVTSAGDGYLFALEVSTADAGVGDVVDPDFGDRGRAAALRAFDDAWKHLSGFGERPPLKVMYLLDPLFRGALHAMGLLPADGPSVYLPTLLAAMGVIAGRTLRGVVVATGDSKASMDDATLQAKASVVARQGTALGVTRALALAEGRALSLLECGGAAIRFCEDIEEAELLAWQTKLAASAFNSQRVHAFCATIRSAPPSRIFSSPSVPGQGASGPDIIELAHLEANGKARHIGRGIIRNLVELREAVGQIESVLDPQRPIELSLGTPLGLAFAMGFRHANRPKPIWVIDAQQDRPWWSTSHKHGLSDQSLPTILTDDDQLMVATIDASKIPLQYDKLVVLPSYLTVGSVPAAVARMVAAVRGRGTCRVALNGPVALAFALGTVLRNKHERVIFYEDTKGAKNRYRPQFSIDSRSGEIQECTDPPI